MTPVDGPARQLSDRSNTIFLGLHNVDPVPGRKNLVLVEDLRDLLTRARDDGWSFSLDGCGPKMILTFYDGRALDPAARELLDEFNVEGLFFICTDRKINSYEDGPGGTPLTDEDMEYLCASHLIGSHTRDHGDLSLLTQRQTEEYLSDSFREFEKRVGTAPSLFSYPWGRYRRSTLRVLDELGIRYSFTAASGREQPTVHDLLIPRVFLDVVPRSKMNYAFVMSEHSDRRRHLVHKARNLLAARPGSIRLNVRSTTTG